MTDSPPIQDTVYFRPGALLVERPRDFRLDVSQKGKVVSRGILVIAAVHPLNKVERGRRVEAHRLRVERECGMICEDMI